MANTREANLDKIQKAVKDYLDRNWTTTHVPMEVMSNSESREHVIQIGTNIMANVMGIETNPGSFVKAVINNDLQESVGRADNINVRMLPFYVTMKYNLSVTL